MKKILGYGYKLSGESLSEAISLYVELPRDNLGFHKTLKEVQKEIQKDKLNGDIPKGARPKVFRVIVETQE